MNSAAGDKTSLEELYQDLHQNPELSFAEHRTSALIAERMLALGLEVTTGIGGTGVVGVLTTGDGPVVMLRADMDALPVLEDTGLPYASTARGVDGDGADVPVMHACGHDVHMACLLGAVEQLVAARAHWSGTVVALFQPGEENGGGAQVMVDDGLYEKIPVPDVVLGQHVFPLPAGSLGAHSGPAMAAVDTLNVRMFGRGGHGSEPESTIDPVVMAAATVMRLQGVVAREVGPQETAVVSVGSLHVGTKSNIISDEARLGLSIRSFDEGVRSRVLASVERIINAESMASDAPRPPEFSYAERYPVTVNDPIATARTTAAFRAAFGEERLFDPGAIAGSEDVGNLASAAGAPLVYWLLGGCDPGEYAAAEAAGTIRSDIPSNHSAYYAPVPRPTLATGVEALVVAAREWLGNPAR
ncbi:amidohydrolase [Cryobacterium tagatosivorans]|uniref:Amidohydrolase n=2 Tax=Cryobacterium tagatosivorans TaxID=1259199 RepID=A0A4R8UJN3_9MICO|nr:amidohydrolase [Cryobacterium tagatosivorans]